MHRKIILSSVAIAAAAALAAGGTFASFSDTDVTEVDQVMAGTLELTVGGTALSEEFSVGNAYPGQSNTPNTGYTLTNSGSLDGELRVYLVKDADAENGCNEAETTDEPTCGDNTDGELDQNINIQVDGNTFGPAPLVFGGLNGLAVGGKVDITNKIWTAGVAPKLLANGATYPGAPFELWFGWGIPSGAGNEIQSDSVDFHLEFELVQAAVQTP